MRIVSVSPSHDASVCVLNDGKIEFFFKEERFSGAKKDSVPYISIYEALKSIRGVVDYCVIASPDFKNLHSIDFILSKLFKCEVIDLCGQHHIQHAALAFENSNFDECLVFVIDRNGSIVNELIRESETVIIANKQNYSLKEIYKNYFAYNLGSTETIKVQETLEQLDSYQSDCRHVCRSCFNLTQVYESATSLIGQDPLENGKTMGLSSYGNPDGFPDLFLKSLSGEDYLIPHDSYFIKDQNPIMGVRQVNFRDLKDYTINKVPFEGYELYADYSKHVQNQTQEQVLEFISHYVNKTGIKNVIVTGGFGMNVVANSFYVKNLPQVNFYFEPIADDTGNSIGGAIYVYKNKTKDYRNCELKNTFFHGYEYSLEKIGGRDICISEVAELILAQKSVAVYQGYAEAGQRALGNRSILFDATNPNAREIVNKIKNREWYRPFAAMILEEDANIYFDMLGLKSSEYMTNSFQVRDEYRELLNGVVHVDGSCRLQTINKEHSLYNLLIEVKNKNKVGVLLNTSFNLAGYPLVETPQQAIETMQQSVLDYLWFPSIGKLLSK